MLRGVDFDVARGSIFALLGSNGAGKTTVVRILSTLLKADAGTASVNGFDVAAQAGGRAGVDQPHRAVRRRRRDPHRAGEPRAGRQAAAPEEPGRDRGRPARPLLAHRRGRAEGVDLLGRHAPPPRHRDEPDRRTRRSSSSTSRPPGSTRRRASRCGRPSRSSPSSGTTVLLTTQYLDEAEQLADRIAILHEGRIIVERHPRRAQAAAPARQGRVRREAADPRGRLPRPRR